MIAVEQLGIALYCQHAFAPAGRAAGHVALADRPAVEPLRHRLAAIATVRTEASAKSSAARWSVMNPASNTAPLWPLSWLITAKPRARAGRLPAATGPIGLPTLPLSPPPPCSRKRPFQSSGSASAKPMAYSVP
jgi:hypothetical protein